MGLVVGQWSKCKNHTLAMFLAFLRLWDPITYQETRQQKQVVLLFRGMSNNQRVYHKRCIPLSSTKIYVVHFILNKHWFWTPRVGQFSKINCELVHLRTLNAREGWNLAGLFVGWWSITLPWSKDLQTPNKGLGYHKFQPWCDSWWSGTRCTSWEKQPNKEWLIRMISNNGITHPLLPHIGIFHEHLTHIMFGFRWGKRSQRTWQSENIPRHCRKKTVGSVKLWEQRWASCFMWKHVKTYHRINMEFSVPGLNEGAQVVSLSSHVPGPRMR